MKQKTFTRIKITPKQENKLIITVLSLILASIIIYTILTR